MKIQLNHFLVVLTCILCPIVKYSWSIECDCSNVFNWCCNATECYYIFTDNCCNGVVHRNPGDNKNCCDTKVYDVDSQVCCNDNIFDGNWCCNDLGYNLYTHSCCNGVISKRLFNTVYENTVIDYCCNTNSYDPESQVCCNEKVYDGNRCCDGTGYNSTTHKCCNNVVAKNCDTCSCCNTESYDYELQGCCGGTVIDYKTLVCCVDFNRSFPNDPLLYAINVKPDFCFSWYCPCCGLKTFDFTSQICCNGKLIEGSGECCGDKVYQPATHACCNENIVDLPETFKNRYCPCCGTKAYDYYSHVCCNNDVFDGNSCCAGNGYNSETGICCNGVVNAKSNDNTKCCNTRSFQVNTEKCCNYESSEVTRATEANEFCCRGDGRDTKSCQDRVKCIAGVTDCFLSTCLPGIGGTVYSVLSSGVNIKYDKNPVEIGIDKILGRKKRVSFKANDYSKLANSQNLLMNGLIDIAQGIKHIKEQQYNDGFKNIYAGVLGVGSGVATYGELALKTLDKNSNLINIYMKHTHFLCLLPVSLDCAKSAADTIQQLPTFQKFDDGYQQLEDYLMDSQGRDKKRATESTGIFRKLMTLDYSSRIMLLSFKKSSAKNGKLFSDEDIQDMVNRNTSEDYEILNYVCNLINEKYKKLVDLTAPAKFLTDAINQTNNTDETSQALKNIITNLYEHITAEISQALKNIIIDLYELKTTLSGINGTVYQLKNTSNTTNVIDFAVIPSFKESETVEDRILLTFDNPLPECNLTDISFYPGNNSDPAKIKIKTTLKSISGEVVGEFVTIRDIYYINDFYIIRYACAKDSSEFVM